MRSHANMHTPCCLQVRRLQELSQINERCMELQRRKPAAASRKSPALQPSSASGCGGSSVVAFGQTQPARPAHGGRRQRAARGSGGRGGCPFLAPPGGAAAWESFRGMVLAAPVDVEELAAMGRKRQVRACCCHCCLLLQLQHSKHVRLLPTGQQHGKLQRPATAARAALLRRARAGVPVLWLAPRSAGC